MATRSSALPDVPTFQEAGIAGLVVDQRIGIFVPAGTPAAIIKDRTWDDYSLGRDTVQAHLAALDLVYNGVIEDTRKAIQTLDDLDLVSQDMLIGHVAELEKFQWFVRAHLENSGGQLANAGASTEKQAATRAKKKAPVK